MNKKGALALSINAIVILIIAITMLGLALGFTRGMFGKAAGQFDEMISVEPEPSTPSAANPVTLSREIVITEAGQKIALKVGYYNTGGVAGGAITVTPAADCGIGLSGNTFSVPDQEFRVNTILITAPATETYLCTVTVAGKLKEFTLKVK
jgi:hypothetical protein